MPGFDESIAIGVTRRGMVVGYSGGPIDNWSPMKYNSRSGTLETFDFPVRPSDINNQEQIVGGNWVGDLEGNRTELPLPPDCISLTLLGINEKGWLVGRAGRPYSDGNGRRLASWVRYINNEWHVPQPGSPWQTGFRINNQGDITIGYGPGWDAGVYLSDEPLEFWLDQTLPPEEICHYNFDYAYGINDQQQIAAASVHAVLLTPVGRTIIPGDVNGDVSVDLADHCDWLSNPVDLDGDGDVDGDDEVWLLERLMVFGHFVQDCNDNGLSDYCELAWEMSTDCDQNGVPDECDPDCNGDGRPDACENDCNGNGRPDPCDIAGGFSEDCNGNGIPDECDPGYSTRIENLFEPPMRLWGEALVTDSVFVPDTGLIGDVDFTIDIDYRIGDLIVLLSHEGTTVTLIDRPGYPGDSSLGNSQFGFDIVLDDQGTGGRIEDQGNFGPPFDKIYSPPSYRPNDALSVFNGMRGEGVWTVTIMTTTVGCPPADTMSSWGLTIRSRPTKPCFQQSDPDPMGGTDVISIGRP